MGRTFPYQFILKPKKTTGCFLMCAAMGRNKESSKWNGLPRKGKRQTEVRRSSQSKVGTRTNKLRVAVTGGAAREEVREGVVAAGIKDLIQFGTGMLSGERGIF